MTSFNSTASLIVLFIVFIITVQDLVHSNEICVSKLYVSELYVSKLSGTVDKLNVSELHVDKLYARTRWRRQEEAAEEEEADGNDNQETRTPHKDMEKKMGENHCFFPFNLFVSWKFRQ